MRIDRDLQPRATISKAAAGQDFAPRELKNGSISATCRTTWPASPAIDDNVGRLLDYLDQNGLAANTIVIYTSDQGFFLGDHDWFDKRFMYEESLRMPFLVRWPGAIKPGLGQRAA